MPEKSALPAENASGMPRSISASLRLNSAVTLNRGSVTSTSRTVNCVSHSVTRAAVSVFSSSASPSARFGRNTIIDCWFASYGSSNAWKRPPSR